MNWIRTAAAILFSGAASLASAGTFTADLTVLHDGKTYKVPGCTVNKEKASQEVYWTIDNKGQDLFDGVTTISISEISGELTEVGVKGKIGLGEQWGKAQKEGECWKGEDFQICLKRTQTDLSQEELNNFSIFLSEFTKAGILNFDAAKLKTTDAWADLVSFGVIHSYLTSQGEKVKTCPVKDCTWGNLVVPGSIVNQAMREYFGYRYLPQDLPSADFANPPMHYDGKYYHFQEPSRDILWDAKVKDASVQPNGSIELKGYIFKDGDPKDRYGSFKAVVVPANSNAKLSWHLRAIETNISD